MHFKNKAIIRTAAEWEAVNQKTRGGDGFSCTPVCKLPVLVLEANNPEELCRPSTKSYIFITADDIMGLLGQHLACREPL